MSTGAMPKKELPPTLERRIDSIVEKIRTDLRESFRFYGWDTIDAVLEILNEAKQPMSMDGLVEKLNAGGIAVSAGDSYGGADGDLKRSIGFFIGRKERIKRVNDLIGLAEWEESRFQL